MGERQGGGGGDRNDRSAEVCRRKNDAKNVPVGHGNWKRYDLERLITEPSGRV